MERGYFGNEATPFFERLQVIAEKRKQFGWDWRVSTIDIEAEKGLLKVQTPTGDVHTLTPTEWAHGQIAEKTGIRKEYYNAILDETGRDVKTDIYGENVNYWFHTYPKVVLVRQMESQLIGLLSDKYRIIDNYDVAMGVLSAVTTKAKELGHKLEMAHAYVSPKSMSYTVYDRNNFVTLPDKPEDKYWLGVSVRNSEVGYTAFEVAPLIVRQVCTNGMIRTDPFRKRHIGSRGEEGDIWSDRTKIAESELILSQVTDMVNYAFDKEKVQDYLNNLGELDDVLIDPTAFEKTADIFKVSQEDMRAIMGTLEQNTGYGLVQSMTSYANKMLETKNPEKGSELQRLAGRIIEDRAIWKMLERDENP